MSEKTLLVVDANAFKLDDSKKKWAPAVEGMVTISFYQGPAGGRITAVAGQDVIFNCVVKQQTNVKSTGETFVQFQPGNGIVHGLNFKDSSLATSFIDEIKKLKMNLPTTNNVKNAEALYDYNGQNEDQLTFEKGAKISQVTNVKDGWCRGILIKADGSKAVGLFPSNYVKYEDREQHIQCEDSSNKGPVKRSLSSSKLTPKPKEHVLKPLDSSDPSTLQAQINSLKGENERLKKELIATTQDQETWEKELTTNTETSQKIISVLQESVNSVANWNTYITESNESQQQTQTKMAELNELMLRINNIFRDHAAQSPISPPKLPQTLEESSGNAGRPISSASMSSSSSLIGTPANENDAASMPVPVVTN